MATNTILMNAQYELGDFSIENGNYCAYIIDRTTDLVVDTFYCDCVTYEQHTFHGKQLSDYGLAYYEEI